MLIAVDGACKRNGQPDCVSSGVAWIQTEDGNLLFKSKFERVSTSQRGEINGLLEALRYAVDNAKPNEDIIIITDSEYLHNTVTNGWAYTWRRNNWVGSTGPVKNADMWNLATKFLDKLNSPVERVYMQWTKGHLLAYTPGNIKNAMKADATGIELFTRIQAIATRDSERGRLIKEFNRERTEHEKHPVPDETAIDWVVANTTADCLASFVVKLMDELAIY